MMNEPIESFTNSLQSTLSQHNSTPCQDQLLFIELNLQYLDHLTLQFLLQLILIVVKYDGILMFLVITYLSLFHIHSLFVHTAEILILISIIRRNCSYHVFGVPC